MNPMSLVHVPTSRKTSVPCQKCCQIIDGTVDWPYYPLELEGKTIQVCRDCYRRIKIELARLKAISSIA